MVFSSILFLFLFLPVFLLVYFLLPYRLKNAWALLASLAFYTWGAPVFVFVLIGSIVFDFLLVKQFKHPKYGRYWIWFGVTANVALLAYFKYANFFVHNANRLLESFGANHVYWTSVALPIGISFFTFQKISYLVDVYRGVRPPLKNLGTHALYVILFPQLIAGPIVRYNEIADELLDRRKALTIDNRLLGFFRFCIGLGKKVLIANVLGEQADLIFGKDLATLGFSDAWLGAIFYTFQIYFDFSGYSDMAIGLGKMMGFKFPENFNNPYIAQSITDFWRRWHITLSTWMRDYLYIPLGGNRVNKRRLYINLWLVFLISGLWHGAAWTFVIWGAYHGLFLVLERMFLLRLYEKLPKLFRVALTFILVIFGWVLFRSEGMGQALQIMKAMCSFKGFYIDLKPEVITTLVLAILFSFFGVIRGVENWQMRVYQQVPGLARTISIALASMALLILSASYIMASNFNPFIYFRF
jgi:alginate O-acetyltransferase complex protein AlgI